MIFEVIVISEWVHKRIEELLRGGHTFLNKFTTIFILN